MDRFAMDFFRRVGNRSDKKIISRITDYKAAVNFLRKYRSDFNYDLRGHLTHYQKEKIRKTVDEILKLESRAFAVSLPRSANKKRNDALLTASGQRKSVHWKKFILERGSENQKVTVRDGVVSLSDEFSTEVLLFWNPKKFLEDPEKEIKRIIGKRKYNRIFVLFGRYIALSPSFESIPPLIYWLENKVFGKYTDTAINLMRGLKLVSFKNQAEKSAYARRIRKERRERKKSRKRKR